MTCNWHMMLKNILNKLANSLRDTLSLQSPPYPWLAVPAGWQWALCVVLGILCILAAARLAGLIFIEPAMPRVEFPAIAGSKKNPIIALYPDARLAVTPDRELTEASFNGKLLGIVYLDYVEEKSLASIAVNGKKEKIYRVGDSLSSGITLEAIEPHRVVVRERGLLRQISLKPEPGGDIPIKIRQPESVDILKSDKISPVAATLVLSDNGVSGLRIDQLNADVRGLKVVEAGDLIIAVDGVGIADVIADQSILGEMVDRESITLTIVRDGREIPVVIAGELVQSVLEKH